MTRDHLPPPRDLEDLHDPLHSRRERRLRRRKPSLTTMELRRCMLLALDLYFGEGHTVAEVARQVRALTGIPLQRYDVYSVFWEAYERGVLVVRPSMNVGLSRHLRGLAGGLREVDVVPGAHADTGRRIADRSAGVVYDLATRIWEATESPVHIGLGIGWTTRCFAEALAQQLQGATRVPPLVFHSLVSADMPCHVFETPAAFSSLFEMLDPRPQWVPFGDPRGGAGNGKGARASWADGPATRAGEIQIVVSSVGDARDPHAYPNLYLRSFRQEDVRDMLLAGGWCGDVQLRCFGPHGALPAGGSLDALSMFSLDDLKNLAETPDRHVVLMCGPGRGLTDGKLPALRPLVEVPDLRIWSHLVIDEGSARGIAGDGAMLSD